MNPFCAAGPYFDIVAPGFDVLAYSLANECATLEQEEAEGEYPSDDIFFFFGFC